ncbi:MAG: HIRAN domain-containing protein [Bacteroidales bacterium]|nr:HIRAN domain-containing protein [Bacteroidales bacterium]
MNDLKAIINKIESADAIEGKDVVKVLEVLKLYDRYKNLIDPYRLKVKLLCSKLEIKYSKSVDIEEYTDFYLIRRYGYNQRILNIAVFNKKLNLKFQDKYIDIEEFEVDGQLFNNDLAILTKNKRYGVINTKNEIIIPPVYTDINNRFYKKDNGNFGIECTKGKKSYIYSFEGELEEVVDNSLLKNKNREQLSIGYESFYKFKVKGKYGLLDEKGGELIPPEYADIKLLEDVYYIHTYKVYAICKKFNGKYKLFNIRQERFIAEEWDEYFFDDDKEFITFRKGLRKGIFFFERNQIIYLDFDFNIDEVMLLGVYPKYFSFSSPQSGKYAIAGGRLNLLTEFIFDHPVKRYGSNGSFEVQYKKYAKNVWEKTQYNESTFFKIFGINSRYMNKIEKAPQTKPDVSEYENQIKINKDEFFLSTQVVGTFYVYRKWQEYPNLDDVVILVPEPDNKYDKNAIAVKYQIEDNLQMLGYIPKELTQTIHKSIKTKTKLKALIDYIDYIGEVPYLEIIIVKAD